jgi:hypothetical protein
MGPTAPLAILWIAFASSPASAATPTIVGRPVVRNPSWNGIANTMMYDVRVTVSSTGSDAGHQAVVGYVADDDYTTCADATTPWKWAHEQTFDRSTTRSWRLYNFVPGTAYRYKVMIGSGSGVTRVRCGMLQTSAAPTPTLPANLAAMNLQYEKSGTFDTEYVLFETDDCGAGTAEGVGYYMVAVDPRAEAIVWYLDVAAMSGVADPMGSGFHYEPGATPAEGRVVLTVDKRYLYEWAFDGTENRFWDFAPSNECNGRTGSAGPCIHHDIAESDASGNTYVLTSRESAMDATGTPWEENCGTDSRFLDDGYMVLDSDWAIVDDRSLMTDYDFDPATDGGPNAVHNAARRSACDSATWGHAFDPAYGVMEFTHANALSVSGFGPSEVLDLSLREWNQVIRFDAETGDVVWRLSPDPDYSDWERIEIAAGIVGDDDFAEQHDVHAIDRDTIMMLDNSGNGPAARVLQIALDESTMTPTIEQAWAVVDAAGNPLECPLEGTAQNIPGSDHVMAMCAEQYAFVELDDPTGADGTSPPLFIQLPDGTPDDFCTSGGPSQRADILGWHKAFPMASIGEF